MSITETKKRLPKDFIDNLYELYSPLEVDKILLGMSTKRLTTLRVNTIKYDIQELMRYFKEKNIKFERIPWYIDGLIIKNVTEKEIKKLDIYEKGYIYLQSLSSMIPPCVLKPKTGEKVLDMTAAPGSKTTQMAAFMQNKGYILANELDTIRCERLKYNVKNQGASIVEVVEGRGEKIGQQYENYFDKILLDAPCSGEGRFLIGSPMTYRDWSIKKVAQLAKLQKKLLQSAYQALKQNGTMIYSTCTLNKEENEEVLEWFISNFHVELIPMELEIKEAIPASIKNAIRVLPSKNTEGFFVAKLMKKE